MTTLTDEEIIVALKKQPAYDTVLYLEKGINATDILNLIHRLQEDYSKLKERYVKVLDLNEKVIAEQKAEIERLTEERKTANKHDVMYWFNAYKECVADYEEYGIKNAELQKQVDELKDERENMRAEILRFEDMKFTQEHCDLYSENEALKQWLKRLNADLECEKNWGKIQTKQAVKDTAKEICDLILEHWEKKQFVECDWLRVAIAEKYGVEVE